jgi:hypothetical protein
LESRAEQLRLRMSISHTVIISLVLAVVAMALGVDWSGMVILDDEFSRGRNGCKFLQLPAGMKQSTVASSARFHRVLMTCHLKWIMEVGKPDV